MTTDDDGDPARCTGPEPRSVIDLWAEQVARYPDDVAVVDGGDELTFAELDERSTAWAVALLATGDAGSGATVAVLLPRGARLVTALLAVLKCGAAYVVIDPGWPAESVRRTARACGSRLAIVDDGTDRVGDLATWAVPAGRIATPDDGVAAVRAAAARIGSADPCCAFLSSGTTGSPKAVLVPHAAVTRLVPGGPWNGFPARAVVPLSAPPSWDGLALELWGALLQGGRVVVVPDAFLTPQALRHVVDAHGVDGIWAPAGVLALLVDEALDVLGRVRTVLTGGDVVSPEHALRLLREHPDVVLVNGYGPVESTVFATVHRVREVDCVAGRGIPVGHPVPGTRVAVLADGEPCGAGEEGEIVVLGTGLGLHYLPRDRDQGGFVEVNLGGRVERAYRTGDLGYRDDEGRLLVLGRIDRQVKVAGLRVDPLDVEQRASEVLDVSACAVVPVRGARGDLQRLVAFVVPRPGASVTGWRERLAGAVLPHQAPSEVVVVPEIPMTVRGKRDEDALLDLWGSVRPRPGPAGAAGGEPQRPAPREPDVELVLQTVRDVLGIPDADPSTPFSQLGGGSLDAARVCARLASATGRDIPLALFGGHSTAGALAAALPGCAPHPRLEPGAERSLSEVEVGLLHQEMLAPHDPGNVCRLVWSVEGELDLGALERAAAAVQRRHAALSARYELGPRPRAVPGDPPPPRLAVLDPVAGVEEAVDAVAVAGAAARLDPAQADLWRVFAVRGGPDRWALGVAVHHVAFDGWSESVLARDLGTAYRMARTGDEVRLPPATPSRPPAPPRPAEIERLRRELAGARPVSWCAAGGGAGFGHRARTIGLDVVAALDRQATQHGATRASVLLNRWGCALRDVLGVDDVLVGVPVALRHTAGAEDDIGCRIGMAVVRLRGAMLRPSGEGAVATADALRLGVLAAGAGVDGLLDGFPEGSPYQVVFAVQDNAPPGLELAGARTAHRRRAALDFFLPLHAEFWSTDPGCLDAVVAHRRDAVSDGDAAALSAALHRHLEDLVVTAASSRP